MMPDYFKLIVAFLFISIAITFALPSHADNFSRTPYYDGQPSVGLTGFYKNPSLNPASPTLLIPNATASNPNGYTASVEGGATVIKSTALVVVPPPSGLSISPVTAASAALMSGLVIAGGIEAVNTVQNPAQVIGAASTFMLAGGAGVGMFNPPVGAGLMAAGLLIQGGLQTCNIVGCDFLNGMAAQGITAAPAPAPAGTFNTAPPPPPVTSQTLTFPATERCNAGAGTIYYLGAWSSTNKEALCSGYVSAGGYIVPNGTQRQGNTGVYLTAADEGCWRLNSSGPYGNIGSLYGKMTSGNLTCPAGYTAPAGTIVSTSGGVVSGQGVLNAGQSCPANSTGTFPSCTCTGNTIASPDGKSCYVGQETIAAAATAAELQAAINAASASPAFTADMTNLAIAGGLGLLGTAVSGSPVSVASDFVELSRSVDNLGNVVQTLGRNISTVTPGTNTGLPYERANRIETVTMVNSTPTATATTAVKNPIGGSATVAGISNGQVTANQCAEYPNTLGCSDISILNDLPAVTPLTSEKNISLITPVSLGVGAAVCPPPLVLPGMFGGPVMYLDIWKYPCDFASAIKPITIAAAGMASIFILMGAFRNG